MRSLIATLVLSVSAAAQIGGTGINGSFMPKSDVTLNTALSFHFTRIVIPAGVTVHLVGTQPARLLCQGDVVIDGVLEADGQSLSYQGPGPAVGSPGAAGPGGFAGGYGGMQSSSSGQGPGGGQGGYTCTLLCGMGNGGGGGHATAGVNTPPGLTAGAANGSVLPFDLVGGSGGGGSAGLFSVGIGGSGGGGVIVLLCDGSITVNGTVSARGGDNVGGPPSGGGGAGGSILLRSLQGISITGTVSAAGGESDTVFFGPQPSGGEGFVRLDVYDGAPSISGTVDPKPLVLRLPYLYEVSPPAVGGAWSLAAVAVPRDIVSFFLSSGQGSIPVPPFGTLVLDPASIVWVGNVLVPSIGGDYDPSVRLSIPVPNDPTLAGTAFCAQAINHLATLTGRPRLTRGICSSISP